MTFFSKLNTFKARSVMAFLILSIITLCAFCLLGTKPATPKDSYRELTVLATAYTHTGNTTATGVWPYYGTVSVDPEVIPLHSKLSIENYGSGTALDTGGDIKGNRIDVFFDTYEEAIQWGRKTVKVKVYYK